jgi:hypothetical protein
MIFKLIEIIFHFVLHGATEDTESSLSPRIFRLLVIVTFLAFCLCVVLLILRNSGKL